MPSKSDCHPIVIITQFVTQFTFLSRHFGAYSKEQKKSLETTFLIPQRNFTVLVKFKFGRVFFCVFFQIYLLHATKKYFFSSVLFVTVSHCKNRFFVCFIYSLRKPEYLFVALSDCVIQSYYVLPTSCKKRSNKMPKNILTKC